MSNPNPTGTAASAPVVTKNISTITAITCGTRRDGTPITRREFAVVRAPEPLGADKSRLWGECTASARHGLQRN